MCSPPTQPIDSTRSAHVFRRRPRQQRRPSGSATHPGVFASCAMFRKNPQREFFLTKKAKLPPPRERLRQKIITLRKQNSSGHPGSGSEWGKAGPAIDLAILKEEGFARLPRRRDDERPQRLDPICGRGRRRKARPVRAHVPNEGGRPVPVPSVPCQDPSATRCWPMPSSQARRCAGRTCDSLTAGDEVVRQRSAQPCHELRLRRGLGAVCWTQRDSKAFLPHGVQLPHPTGRYPQIMRSWFDTVKKRLKRSTLISTPSLSMAKTRLQKHSSQSVASRTCWRSARIPRPYAP